MDLREKIAGKLKNLVSTPIETGNKNAAVVAVASSKGGVGKTTTCVNLGVAFARAGARVLLVDLDAQAHVAAALQSPPPGDTPPLSDVFLGRLREVCEVSYAAPWANLELAGGDKTLAETESIIAAKIGKELLLADALSVTRTHYDLILLDCPPNLGTLTLNALCAADQLLVPADMSVLALEGVGDILGTLETVRHRLQRPIELLGVVATRVDRRATRTNDTITESFADLYGDALLQTQIPQSSAVNQAHLAGKPIFEYAKRSPGAGAYARLASELAARLGLGQFLAARDVPAATTATSRVTDG